MALRDYIRVFRRDWPVIVVCLLLGFSIAALVTAGQKPVYKSTSSVFVAVQSPPSSSDLAQGVTFTQQMVLSYADLATKPIVLDPVIADLKLRTTASSLSRQVTAEAPLDTVIIDISVTDSEPVAAARIANSVSANLIAAVTKLSPTTGSNISPIKVAPVEAATVATTPTTPIVPLNLIIGIAAGLVVAVLASVAREALDVRIRDLRDFELVSDRPVVGAIPADSGARRSPLIIQPGASRDRAEAFRTLRTNLQFLDFGQGARAIVITSSGKGEGKSTSAANLAIATADAGVSVALVDADLREPMIAEYFGLDNQLGLTDVLAERSALGEVSRVVRDNLTVIPSGHVPPNPSEQLQSEGMVRVVDQLTRTFDVVIFDSPALLSVSDAAILARRTSGALIVGEAGRATRHELRDAVRALDRIEAPVIGLIVTMLPKKRSTSFEHKTTDQLAALNRAAV